MPASGNNVFRIRQQDPPGQFCIPQYDLPVLTAEVNDDATIHLRFNGQELDGQTLPQGAYRLELDDNSQFHNFHLLTETGSSAVSCVPRQNCASDIAGTGHETWVVNFTTGGGSVTYLCDAHPATMRGTFTIGGPRRRHRRRHRLHRHHHLRHRHRHRLRLRLRLRRLRPGPRTTTS